MNDEECRYLGSSTLSTSCRGSAEAFARSLQRRFNSLKIGTSEDDTVWYQNGNGHQIDEYRASPLSPENETPNPLSSDVIGKHFLNPELFLNTKPIEFDACGHFLSENCENQVGAFRNEDLSSSENLIDNSSVDDNYETASDLSADELDAALSDVIEDESTDPEKCLVTDSAQIETSEVSIIIDDSEEHRENGRASPSQSSDEIASPKLRRCSSLKTGKTPPGTPGGKKIVRFADALGLDLADVKTFVDEIPKIPTSAFDDLNTMDDDLEDMLHMKLGRSNDLSKSALIPLFTQPGEKFDFMERIRRCNVCLEFAVLEDPISCCIKGVVRVRNIDFHKTVFVRYSTDRWRNSLDVQASYVNNSCDGFSDKFSFLIYANMLRLGDKLEFAVCFLAKGNEYWDNNNGVNYIFECISTQAVTLAPLVLPPNWEQDNWGAAFY